MKKQNLTEEIYKMRKLMNFDSKEFNENVTSLDRLIERKIISNRLNEQNEEPPKFHDWTKGGKFNWDKAKIKDIIQYIEEVDAYTVPGIGNIPAYKIMMEWYRENDSEETRNSLRAWLFGDIYYGIDKVDAKETKKNTPDEKLNDKELQDSLPIQISNINIDELITQFENITITNDNKKIVVNIKNHLKNVKKEGTLEKLNKEITTLNNSNILIGIDEIKEMGDIISKITNFDVNQINDESLSNLNDSLDDLDRLNLQTKGKIHFAKDRDFKVTTGGNLEKNVAIKKDLLKKVQTEFNKWGVSPEKLLKKCDQLKITDKPAQLEFYRKDTLKDDYLIKKDTSETDMFQYPVADEPEERRNNLGNNFFDDDGTTLSQPTMENIRNELLKFYRFVEKMQKEVNVLKNTYPKVADQLNLEIVSFNVFTFASTSKVRTRYKSKDKTFSEANNIKLAEDRCDEIYNFIQSEIAGKRSFFKRFGVKIDEVILASKATKPNIGPGWQKLDGVVPAPGGGDVPVPLKSYGKLFQEAHEKYKDKYEKELTPQKFYGSRTDAWAKRASKLLGRNIAQEELSLEYEDVYGPFRMNLAGFNATVVMPEVIDKSKIEQDYYAIAVPGLGLQMRAKQDFDITTTIQNLKSGIKRVKKKVKKFFKGLKPPKVRVRFPKFGKTKDFRSIACPKW
jgi:hypothetical protein